MNKQELIKHFEEMEYVSIHQMGKKSFIDLIEKLDEPQKPVVPQFVADLIKYAKEHDWDLEDTFQDIAGNDGSSDIYQWYYCDSNNMDTFARAWLDGYEVEKEKRYRVKVKGVSGEARYLNREVDGDWYINNKQETHHFKVLHTRKELEEANFGWVFDCEGIEIEEVE